MKKEHPYTVLAYYLFCPVEKPHQEVRQHKRFLQNYDATARIYISEQGINGQLCLHTEHVPYYVDWMSQHPLFKETKFKLEGWHEHAFPRLTVKYRKELVAVDAEVNLSERGEHVSPERWKEMLEDGRQRLLIDVRNDYESRVGHFEGAERPACERFREFPEYLQQLRERHDPEKTEVMMYCTGGIRCEVFSAMMKQEGFDKIYQLDGGVIQYGKSVGSKHWLGKLFVFDDRLTVPLTDEEDTEVVGECHHCKKPSEAYYNCANMDCNELFLCCPSCLEEKEGCCSEECQNADRIRPYSHQNPHKPFRRWHHYSDHNKA